MKRFILLSIIKHPHDKNSSRPQQNKYKKSNSPPPLQEKASHQSIKNPKKLAHPKLNSYICTNKIPRSHKKTRGTPKKSPGGGMVDALVSGASAARRAGSSPVLGTHKSRK